MIAPTWLDVLDETVGVCAAHGRADLVRSLRQRRAQLLDPGLRVLVIGEPKQGKSQLVNALINAPVCPVGGGPEVPTVIQHAAEPYATLVRTPAPGPDGDAAGPVDRTPLPLTELSAGFTDRLAGLAPAATQVEVGVPRGLLATGLVLIDTPGAAGPDPTANLTALAATTRADAVLLVSDATRELSVTELNLLLIAMQTCPRLIVALTKTDLAPDWRVVAEHNRRHLAGAGIPAAQIPVSAALRLRAAAGNDKAINAESGFPTLIGRLTQDLTGKGDGLARASVGLLTRTVIEQLAAPLRAELARVNGGTPAPLSKLHQAQRAVDELRRCSQRWQNALSDEMADLMADLEYDLRDRSRAILRRVDEALDNADPLPAWPALRDWFAENLTEAATANHEWLVQRCDWIARQVADHFLPYRYDVLPAWSVRAPDLAGVPTIEQPQIERFTPTQKVFSGLRGSYGGVLMFGLATTLAGLPLINPVSLGAGALFGGKSIWDESRSLRKRRQAVVKAAAQRHVDDFFLRISKQSKEAVRQVQRTLRDHFTALTEQLQEEIVHSFRTAKQAADADAAEREQRHREIQRQMKRLAVLYEEAQALATGRSGLTRLEPTG
nr:dynamin family protein [Micromonospora sp. DSM 115978]